MKYRYIAILLLIVLSLFSGCLKKKKITGKEYIPQEVLVDVLVDIHLIDGVVEDRKYYRKYNFNDSIDMMTPIFQKYGVTREIFDSTIAEYTRHHDLLDKVYDEVIMKLNFMLDEIDEREKKALENPEDKPEGTNEGENEGENDSTPGKAGRTLKKQNQRIR